MAADVRYVATASAGGDGTTDALSGANAAYASMGSLIANYPNLDLVAAGDTLEIRCFGTVDTSGPNFQPFITDATNFITIKADRTKPDGFYDGTLSFSESHYHLKATGFVALLRIRSYTVVDGLQVWQPGSSVNHFGIGIAQAAFGHQIRNCRIRGGGGTSIGIGLSNNHWCQVEAITNNLIFNCGTGVRGRNNVFAEIETWPCYNNTIWGCAVAGINVVSEQANTTALMKNNLFFDNASDIIEGGVSVTHIYDSNAGQDTPPVGETNTITLGTLTDEMEDPLAATGSEDVRPKSGGGAVGAGVGNSTDGDVPTTDILGNARSTTAPTIGAFEISASGGGGGDVLPHGLHQIENGNTGLSRASHSIEEGFVA